MLQKEAAGKLTCPWVKSPYPPVNIPIPTKIGSKKRVAHLPQNGTTGFDPQPLGDRKAAESSCPCATAARLKPQPRFTTHPGPNSSSSWVATAEEGIQHHVDALQRSNAAQGGEEGVPAAGRRGPVEHLDSCKLHEASQRPGEAFFCM